MIYDSIENVGIYRSLHPNLALALDYLARKDLAKLDPGQYEVEEGKVFFFIQDNLLSQERPERFEYHQLYADIHLVLEGVERCLYGWDKGQATYDADTDLGFVTCEKEIALPLEKGMAALFFPGEAHQPNQFGGGDVRVKKCVMKVRMAEG